MKKKFSNIIYLHYRIYTSLIGSLLLILKKVLYPTETCRFVLKLFRRIKTTVHSSQRVGFGVINYL